MAEVYEDITRSSTDDVIFALDGQKKKNKAAFFCVKKLRRRGPLYLYICKNECKSLCAMSLDKYFRE
jgi:hypothetical protein